MKSHNRPERASFSAKEVSPCNCSFNIPTTPEAVMHYEASKGKSSKKPHDAPSAIDILKKHQRL
jgi:hypothetical protein